MATPRPSSSGVRRLRILATVPFLVSCAGHHAAGPPAPLRSPARDSLLAVDVARGTGATGVGLGTAAAMWLDTGVVYLRSGAPIVYGRAAALTVLAAGAPEHATYAWRPLGG